MLVTIVWISNFVLVTLISFLLILVQAKSAIQEIQSNKPEITSRGSPSIPTQQDSSIFLSEEKLREIFNVTEHVNPLSYNVGGDRDKFQVQRTTSGNLEVVVNNTTISSSQSQASSSSGKRAIIFPDVVSRIITDDKKDITFHTNVDDYPKESIEKMIQAELVKYEKIFGVDLLVTQTNPTGVKSTQRFNGPGEEDLCLSKERLIYPQKGITNDDSWQYIVNLPNYKQGVRVEECDSPGKPCSMTGSFPNGYSSTCRQFYIYRELLSYDKNGGLVKKQFRLPASCKCIIRTPVVDGL